MAEPTPPPVIGSSWVYCPFTDTERLLGGMRWWSCRWRKRLRAGGLAKYRRHWMRKHHDG